MKPQPQDYPSYYGGYISLIKQNEVLSSLTETTRESLGLIRSIPIELENHAYADGKWTIKELLLHCIDTERIFSCRALGFARGEAQKALPFEENNYAAHSHADKRSLNNIAAELEAVGKATVALFASFSEEVLAVSGQTPSGKSTVNAMGFMIAGHTRHHLDILKERYLK